MKSPELEHLVGRRKDLVRVNALWPGESRSANRRFTSATFALLLGGSVVGAQSPLAVFTHRLPDEPAILELLLPEGATARVDEREVGSMQILSKMINPP